MYGVRLSRVLAVIAAETDGLVSGSGVIISVLESGTPATAVSLKASA